MAATTLADRAVIRLSGEDVRGFLQGLLTSDMNGPLPVWAALLSPQGKCLFDLIVHADGDDLLIDCEASAVDGLIRRLSLYRLRRPITIERDPNLAAHWAMDGDAPVDPRLVALGKRWIAAPSDPAEGWRAHRLGLGVCEGQAELGDLLWLECNAAELNGVGFDKGCFVGQENTARMNWRSKVNRRLFVVPSATAPADRLRVAYPELGWAVIHARIDAIPEDAVRPAWLEPALAAVT